MVAYAERDAGEVEGLDLLEEACTDVVKSDSHLTMAARVSFISVPFGQALKPNHGGITLAPRYRNQLAAGKQTVIMRPRQRVTFVKRGRRVSMTLATDEITTIIEDDLKFGKVISMSRAGSSGWAVMHRAMTESGKCLFIKVSRESASMFEGEAAGLSSLFDTHTIRVPQVHATGSLSSLSGSYIIMEALQLYGMFDMAGLGRDMARLHLATPVLPEARDGQFGFVVDNTIGATPQPNGWMYDWIEFFKQRRLRHQVLLTNDANLIEKGNRLCSRLDELFEDLKGDDRPTPSLLHGDLWSGNVAGVENAPVIFDPACYYGHHEAEFGMLWCMQLTAEFWSHYRKLIPKAEGFDRRLKLYQLYHYLNHYNLFGGSYYGIADHLLTELLNSLPST